MYFAVLYLKDKTIHLWPNESKEACEEKLYNLLKDERVYLRVDRTTIIKRELKEEDAYVFGCPASLNIKEKFAKDLEKGKVEFEYD